MNPDELLVATSFPVWRPGSGFAIREVSRRASDFAIVGAVAGIELGTDGSVARSTLALFGVDGRPVPCHEVEAAVYGRQASELASPHLGVIGAKDLAPPSDVHGSSAYRTRVAATLTPKVLAAAAVEATRGIRLLA
jgi:aerobic carbon-monoxide dehydrogenase medium subunit